ncbi:type VI secretion-associated protein, VC_A0118 family [Citrobacter koseri]|uniref:type VI secretion system-associated protein VasI n=1 Tax=Citrobacter koseri TaxID=545 RepID=UPI000E144F22|nr:type VI secretion system-associated protein VasI [Citrobacter koseri]SUX93007.1 type VI secretion-associated protein, VC_A0118 family [Citrobacter koseri]
MKASIRRLLPLLLMTSSVYAGEVPDVKTTVEAMNVCRQEHAALERLDCYDRILSPEPDSGFAGALVKARYDGEARRWAVEQEKQRQDNSTELLLIRTEGVRPMVIITAPAIGSLPPRPVLMFSCVDNITRMQVALTASRQESDIPVTLNTENGQFRSRWFVRENGFLLEASRGLAGIDEIKQLFSAKTLTLVAGSGNAGKLTFNIDGLAQTIAPLRKACHWVGK